MDNRNKTLFCFDRMNEKLSLLVPQIHTTNVYIDKYIIAWHIKLQNHIVEKFLEIVETIINV